MEKLVFVSFDNEQKAYEATRALAELDREASISVYAEAVISKDKDGKLTSKMVDDDFPIRSIGGTSLGALIGLIGGPTGMAVGALTGGSIGFFGDLYVADVNTDFVQQVTDQLRPGRYAVVADLDEEWITPLDTRMESLGGVVFRTVKERFEEEKRAKEMTALRLEVEQLQKEHAQAKAERKAKLQAKIDELTRSMESKRADAQRRAEQIKSEADAKITALQKKAVQADRDRRAAIHAKITRIQEDYERSVTKLRTLAADRLRKAADALEKAG